jgi:predicted transcriptional regulator
MSREVVMSIKPKYAQAILDGTKKYEFRKTHPLYRVGKVYIYETAPTKAIVGWFVLLGIEGGCIGYIKSLTELSSDEEQYCKKCGITHAWEVGKVTKFNTPMAIKHSVPQSWRYAKEGEVYHDSND